MPIFEYKCDSCNTIFEELVYGGDEKPQCPKCGSEKTHRILSPVRWKGAGGGGSPSPCSTCNPGPSGCKSCSK